MFFQRCCTPTNKAFCPIISCNKQLHEAKFGEGAQSPKNLRVNGRVYSLLCHARIGSLQLYTVTSKSLSIILILLHTTDNTVTAVHLSARNGRRTFSP